MPISDNINLLVCTADELLPHFPEESTVAIWVGALAQREDCLPQARANRAVDGEAMPTGVLLRQIDDIVLRGPGLVDPPPGIERRLIDVDECFVSVNHLLQHARVLAALSLRDLEAAVLHVASSSIAYSVLLVQPNQRVGAV